jgi:hypothetical protein
MQQPHTSCLLPCRSPGRSRAASGHMTSRFTWWSPTTLALALVVLTPASLTAQWTQQLGAGPSARSRHAMAYDAARDRMVLFGGGVGTTRLDETWELAGTTWTQRSPTHKPSPRGWHAMAYDSNRSRVVLFGGSNAADFGDTWEWDGSDWTDMSPTGSVPSARSRHALAYDPQTQKVLLFGGSSSTMAAPSTWGWDGTSWTVLATSGPIALQHPTMAHDAVGGGVVLFGGDDGSAGVQNQTWVWNGTGWTQPAGTAPPHRTVHSMSSAGECGVMVFGGLDPGTPLFRDTWMWNASWTLAATTGPTGRANLAMAYDSLRSRVVLFGGDTSPGQSDATWVWPCCCTGPDLWVRDGYQDSGAEPSAVQFPWTSPSIWVRNNPDAGTDHQNPVAGATNTVYVRVRNRSACQPIASAQVKLYWAKASSGLSWPSPWDGSATCGGGSPMGGAIDLPAGKATGVVPAGGWVDLAFTWATTPIPSLYAQCDADQTHFCLLARIDTPMTVVEGSDLGANVRNNNNICWRNLTVVDVPEGSLGGVMLSNYTPVAQWLRTRFEFGPGMPQVIPQGALTMAVSPNLMAKWLAGGQSAYGLQPSPTAAGTFEILQDGAWLGNLAMAPGEHVAFQVHMTEALRAGAAQGLTFDVLQQIEGTPPSTVGGQQFTVPTGVPLWPVGTRSFGLACPGTQGAPRNVPQNAATLGTTWQAAITDIPPQSLVVALLSLGQHVPPLPLDFLGAPGCFQHVPADATVFLLAGAASAPYGLSIPNAVAYLGLPIHTQGAVFDPAANPLGLVTTNGLRVTVGL